MPQISQLVATFASQFFWLAVTFGLVFFVIGRGMVPKVQATVDARDQSVADDLKAAEAARAQADATEEQWRAHENAAREAAQKRIAEARAKATAATEGKLAAANAANDAKLAAAETQIASASASAMTEIETVAAEAARDIVARLSGVEVPVADAQAKVKAVLAHG
ncbi:ATPase [Sphingomonas japonica]|uniref:ATP synthase subunit b n=1 Tax=Sphingomonas japonica TaxID=511662 RepID=A0ABX0U3Z3_9SPHN|nr:ATPase [Sphingomonas japonica]NIJ24381.1 F-type H+-transporting ATPase subunit b [Sphingomonas japonica]